MNEHDSERLAGALIADGLVADPRPRVGRRGGVQHLLHPGERRQQVLRPPGQPQGAARAPARHADRGGRLPGPDGPGADPRAGPPRRRGVRHPQPDPGTGPAAAGAPRRARWSRSSTSRCRQSDPRPATSRWRPGRRAGPALRRLGDHPDRVRQLLCLLHRPVGARRRGLPAHGRPGGRGARPWPAGASPRSPCSART